jgi:superfamily II DNA or RNA helicase
VGSLVPGDSVINSFVFLVGYIAGVRQRIKLLRMPHDVCSRQNLILNVFEALAMETGNHASIRFDRGTIVLESFEDAALSILSDWVQFDTRTRNWRGEGRHYREVALALRGSGFKFNDLARSYNLLPLDLKIPLVPRSHQVTAITEWTKAGRRGVVSLPTGAGKTVLAVMCMSEVRRPTLICVPTIDLMNQWRDVLQKFFSVDVGMLGGGSHDIKDITVATYDSAALQAERLGPKFGFVIFDECHHLPAPGYSMIAQTLIAPFRLGLSATIERADGGEERLYDLVGDLVFEGRFGELEEKTLAPYKVVQVEVEMTTDELTRYNHARSVYKAFLRSSRINFADGDGWAQFIALSARSPQGRAAMQAFREQKRLAHAASNKLLELWRILNLHRGERVIVFTDENSLAYNIGRQFFVPVLTHHTKPLERTRILESFKRGEIRVIATSKVLNEGVDVPEASVGVVLSGSGTVREHVQRLGRILRHQEGKNAVLYEIISRGTSEKYVNQRRRQHYAYQGTRPGYNS